MATLNRDWFQALLNNPDNQPAAPRVRTDDFNAQPTYSMEDQGKISALDTAQKMLALMDQYGVNDLKDLPDSVRNQLPNRGEYYSGGGGSLFQQLASFVTSPAFLVLAGGVAGVAAGGAAAAAGGAEAGAAGGAAGGTGITAGAAGQTGLTAGTATGGIGAGALGSGLTAGGSTAGLGTAAAGAGALGSGYFGSETAYPVTGGQTAAATGAGGGTGAGTTAAQGTALSRLLNGTATQEDYLALAGQVAPALLQAYGANQQQGQLSELANKYIAMGAPYRDQLASISQDPSQFYNSPGAQQALDATLRKLSVQGNPAGSPYSQSLAIGSLYDRYGQERQLLGNLGGLASYNAAAPQTAQNAIGAGGQVYNAIGTGLGNVLNPQPSLADMFKKYGTAAGQYGYGY